MKIAILGLGHVGSSIAANLVIEEICSEMVLVTRRLDSARAEALDLQHSVCVSGAPMRVTAGDLADAAGADLVMVTVSVSVPQGSADRDLYARGNGALMRELLPEVARHCPNAVLLILSNPLDALTTMAIELTGFPWQRVIGSGTLLDSARWRAGISAYVGVHSDDIRAYVIGEHGPNMVPLISTANIAGQRAEDPVRQAELAARCMQEGLEVFRTRGYTNHAIARAVTMIARAVARNRRETMPVSVLSDGYAGIDGVCMSLPCVIGTGGVHRIMHPVLSEPERTMLRQGADSIRRTLAVCRG